MKLDPVLCYPEPAYPTRQWVRVHPEILRRLPARWRNNPFVLAVLAAVPALGCSTKGSGRSGEADGTGSSATGGPIPTAVGKRDPLAKVAPVFEHGKGVASTGGVAATRIVFISEDEAVRVVIDEAAKAGLELTPGGRTLDHIPLPATNEYGTFDSRQQEPAGKGRAPVSRDGKLELDGTDAKHKVSFELVSKQDFDAWKVPGELASTLTTFDLVGTARVLREGIDRAAPAGFYAVFYDPLPPYRQLRVEPSNDHFHQHADEEATLEQSRAELRAQVRDFIGWLKAQGAL